MTGVLLVGFLLGMTHALEADHLAAVATLASRSTNVRTAIRTGLLWGLGHMTMLALVGGVALAIGTAIPEQLAALLETLVGVMLVVLGIAALRVHDAVHRHPKRWRPFVVGLVHGMAGSAALVMLAAGAVHDVALGVGYVLFFGIGSLIGMGVVSFAFAWPMHYASRRLPRFATIVSIATGVVGIAVGVYVIASSAPNI